MSSNQPKSKAKQRADEAVDRSSSRQTGSILKRLIPGIENRGTESQPAPPNSVAPSNQRVQPLQIEAPPNSVAPSKSERAQGFLRVTNELVDEIMPNLRPSEQVVLLRLYRLTRGFGEATCTVSIGTLASRCHLKLSQTRTCLKELERRGLIKRLGIDLSNPVQDLRGITFQMFVDGPAPSKIGGASNSVAPSKIGPIKEKDLKKDLKRGDIPNDYKTCPDCSGSGFWYPEGTAKGVAKCPHTQLKASS